MPHPGQRAVAVISESTEGLRKTARARSLALTDGKASRIELSGSGDRTIAILPLVYRGETIGLVEVLASTQAIEAGWKLLQSIADQAALMLRTLQDAAALSKEIRSAQMLARIAHDLVRARATSKAVDDLARVCSQTFGAPVAAWAVGPDLTRLGLISRFGFSGGASKGLQETMRTIKRLSAGGSGARSQLLKTFSECTGLAHATTVDGRDAVLVIGAVSPEIDSAVEFIQPMLKDVLHRLSILALADLHHERLDLGISWTAHELRGPLTGTRAVIDLLLQTADEESRTQHLLKRSREDLDRMSALVDGALRVTMTDQSLSHRPTRLMRVIKDAINMCRAERSNVDIALQGEPHVLLQADPPHLTGAIANVLRNSLWHSPPSSPIDIDVSTKGSLAQIRITDKGPRVSGDDKEMIFDPFGRGESPRAVGRGKGLGLFIARRVIESHGGTIKVGSSSSGAMFLIDLPLAKERRKVSAS